jgi:UDP-N-acetyl-D-mannosaminuronic acid dehydrogenase
MKLPTNYRDDRVCIIGLGYVGLTLAVALAEAGFTVRGIERDTKIVDAVNCGRAHFKEAGLDPRLAAQVVRGTLSASDDWSGTSDCNVFIITVGTPLDSNHATNLQAIRDVSAKVAEVIQSGALVILRSTVRLGVCRQVVKPVLDRAGVAYDLAFCPERTLEGRALAELRSLPQIVGGVDENSTHRASHMFNFVTPTTIRVRDLETAEMIKLINNTQRDLLFAFANEVAELCDTVGVSATEVIKAGNMGYLRASMPLPGPVGGPCLEKDPYILAEGVRLQGGQARLALLGRQINEELPYLAVRRMSSALKNRNVSRVAILGLAFKGRPETSDLRGSLVIPLIEQIKATYPGVRLIGYDPAVGEADTVNLGLVYASTVAKAFEGADAIIFQNNNESFGLFDMLSLSQSLKPDAVIYDMWNQFEPETLTLRSDVLYFGYGTHALIGQRRESINLSPPIGFPPTFDEQVFPPRAYARTGG